MLLDCLEGPPANACNQPWSDREEASSPLTLDELWERLGVGGSRLPEDHYHEMLKSFPSFWQLIGMQLPGCCRLRRERLMLFENQRMKQQLKQSARRGKQQR